MYSDNSIEVQLAHQKNGWIEVICGGMFSGKTEELIRRINRAKIAKLETAIFKPGVDTRYHSSHVISHNSNTIYSIPVEDAREILDKAGNSRVIAIDEAQFFDEHVIEVCTQLANNGIRVIVAGLDTDYRGMPFGYMPQLLAIAEYVTKLHAICVQCGNEATYSYRLVASEETVLLGETDLYESRCRKCFFEGEQLASKNKLTESSSEV